MIGAYAGIHFGADFNPDQWDESTLDEDIRLMKEAGLTIATPAVFSWARIQPEEGVFDFAWLDRVLDRLHEAGIAVDLATATASPPPWLGLRYPETLPITADGTRLIWGSRQQYNPSSERFRQACAALVTALATRYASHPALAMWHVGNEYACHVAESFDDESAARFRDWLLARYGSIDEVNRVWGTAFWSQRYGSWDEIMPPRATPTFANPNHTFDWRRFSSDMVLECFTNEVSILRRLTPSIPITTNFMGLFPWLDYWKWAEQVDVVSNDTYPDPADPRAARSLALEADLMRSLAGGKPFIQMEQTPSAVQWRPRNAPKRPGQFPLWSMQLVARGADGICQFQWRQSASGSEMFHSGMVPHSGAESSSWAEMVQTGQSLALLSSLVSEPVSARVAIVWDWENAWAIASSVGPVERSAFETAAAWHAALFERGYVVDFVRPGAPLDGYELVVAPQLFRLGAETAAALTAAASAGATVLVTSGSGYVDLEGHAYLGGYLGPLAPVLGVRVTDILPRGDEPGPESRPGRSARISGAIAVRENARVLWEGRAQAGAMHSPRWAERVVLDGAEVIARFSGVDVDGLPAITRKANGAGEAWYVAAELDAEGLDGLLAELERRSGLRPELAAAPRGVEAVRRGDALVLLNHSDDPVAVDGVSGRDLLSGRVADDGVTIAPRSAVILAGDPARL